MKKILLIGDPKGNADEGMRNIALNLSFIEDCELQFYFVSIKEVLIHLSKYNDVSIVHYLAGPTWKSFISLFIIKLLIKTHPKTIISFIHPRWNIIASLMFRLFKPDAVIVQSEKWKRLCSKVCSRVYEVPVAGVDSERFFPASKKQKIKIRKELGLDKEKLIVLHVGHLIEGRNLKIFNSFNESIDIYPIVIGSSTTKCDMTLVNELKNSNVNVINKYIPNIEKYYQAADCYLFPTVNSNNCIQIPLSILEAQACNLSVITTRFEALPYLFPYNQPGFQYIDNFFNITKIIRKVSFESFNGINRISKYSWKSLHNKFAVIYKELDEKN